MNPRPRTPQSVTLPAIPRAGLCLPEVTTLTNLLKSARILARIARILARIARILSGIARILAKIARILARIAVGTERICYAPHVVS